MEVPDGARRAERELDLPGPGLRFQLLAFNAATDVDGAVRIYRRCGAAVGHSARHSRLLDRSRHVAHWGNLKLTY